MRPARRRRPDHREDARADDRTDPERDELERTEHSL
jgi:hypothetical protein